MSDETEAVSILRACILSNKGGVSLSILNRDYKSLVGDNIPYKKLGYSSVEDFLKSIKDINLKPCSNGDVIVTARPSEASAHIASLVRRQKSSGKRRPIPSYCNSRKSSNNIRRPPPSNHHRMPPPAPRHSQPSASRALSITVNNNECDNPGRLVTLRKKGSNDENKNRNILSPRLENSNKNTNFSSSHHPQYSSNIDEIRLPNNDYIAASMNLNEVKEVDYEKKFDYGGYQSGIVPVKPVKSITCPFTPKNAVAAGRANIQALAVKELEDKYISRINEDEDTLIKDDKQIMMAPWSRNKQQWTVTFINKLAEYVEKNKLPNPIYKIISRKPKSGGTLYVCQVFLSDFHTFSSYPEEARYPEDAKELAAKKAYFALCKTYTDSAANLKTTSDPNLINERLLSIVKDFNSGLWANSIEALYSEKFKETLPPRWESIAMSSPLLNLEKICSGRIIISPNNSIALEDTKSADSLDQVLKFPKVPTIKLLPLIKHWDVFISAIDTYGDVWLRLIGDDYSEKYENMASSMEAYYKAAIDVLRPCLPKNIKIDEFYAARLIDDSSGSNDWLRVQVMDINIDEQTANCHLIDVGESDTISFEQLYFLHNEFSQLPKQAVLCSLHEIKFDKDYEIANDSMGKLLLGKTLVAEVIERDDNKRKFSLILFDTNGEEDVNLNEELNDLIVCEKSFPELPDEMRVKEATVSYIRDNGHLYIQIQSDIFSHLHDLIDDLKTESILNNCLKSTDNLSYEKIYLAKYEDDSWYRAVVCEMASPETNKVKVEFIDYGNQESIEIVNICDLEAISLMLCKIPSQAVLVSLHGLNDISSEDIIKLKQMISETQDIVVKVVSLKSEIPEVEIFKRSSSDGGVLISINNSITLQRNLSKNSNRKSLRRVKSSAHSVTRPQSPSFVETVHCSLKPPELPNVATEFFDVLVIMAAHPHNFIIQPLKNIDDLRELKANMLSFYNENIDKYHVSLEHIIEGGLYAARFDNNQWYRITLATIEADNTFSVYSCDFGQFYVVPLHSLRYLAPQFTELPYQGIKAKLSGIVPMHGDWTGEDCIRFSKLVDDKQLVSLIMEKSPDVINPNVTALSLQLVDTSTDEDIVISRILIDEKRAIPVSKIDN